MMDEDARILALAELIYRQRVKRARQTPLEQKLLSGGELFDAVRERMIWGIRAQFPLFTDEQVHAEYLRRLDLSRKLERNPFEAAS